MSLELPKKYHAKIVCFETGLFNKVKVVLSDEGILSLYLYTFSKYDFGVKHKRIVLCDLTKSLRKQ